MPTRREFLKLAAFAAASSARLTPNQKLETFNYESVRLLESPLRRQVDYTRNFFTQISDDSLLLGFRQRAGLPAPGKPLLGWYGGDPSRHMDPDIFNAFGQYISGMSRLAKATGDKALAEKTAGLVEEWAKTIEPDGYFYYSRGPHTPHYIYEKTVCGLVDLYEYGGRKEAIPALERITAWADKNLDRSRKIPLQGTDFGTNGQEWYTLSENLYRAYHLTGDDRYKRFAGEWHYPYYWGMFDASAEPSKTGPNPYGFHAYSHVNTLSSAAMTYAVTSDPAYLRTIINAYDWLQKTQTYATGGFGPGEHLLAPDGSLGKELDYNANTFETVCGSWAIFKLGRYLISFTGEVRYGDWMEKMLYNGIGASLPLMNDGRNFYYSDYRVGGCRKIYNQTWQWSCCSGTYPQAIADYHNIIYFQAPGAIYVNLFVPSEVDWQHQGQVVRLRQGTVFPESETARFSVQSSTPSEFTLNFRVPGWCPGLTVDVNGKAQNVAARPGTWAEVRRKWTTGDTVTVRLPMHLGWSPVNAQHPRRAALTYGPVVLMRKAPGRLATAVADATRSFTPGNGPLEFQTKALTGGAFVPFDRFSENEAYEVYFDLD